MIDEKTDDKIVRDDESSGEGDDSANGTLISVGGAVSKSDGDARMSKKVMNRIMRAASVVVRAMADKGDAMDKARSGQYNTLDSEVKGMSGQDLYNYMSTNPAQMDKTGVPEIQQKMINDGYGKQLDVLTHGTYEAAQKTGRKEVMGALMTKPLSEMDPAQQSYIWDKLSELGQVSGEFDGNLATLESVVGDFVMSSKSGEQLVNQGRVALSGGGDIKGPDPGLKIVFASAVQGITDKVVTAYRQVLKHIIKPPDPGM